VNKKPFFRAFDGCWYAYRQVGTKRRAESFSAGPFFLHGLLSASG